MGIEIILPKKQDEITKIILNITSGKKLDSDILKVKKIIEEMKKKMLNQ